MKKKIALSDVWHFIVGNIRYRLFYSWFHILIPVHIKEQIKCRIRSMNPICYAEGSCMICGCRTTELQMANKSCKADCYPRMLNKCDWKLINISNNWLKLKNGETWGIIDGKFVKK